MTASSELLGHPLGCLLKPNFGPFSTNVELYPMSNKAYTDKRTPRTKAMRRIEDAAWKHGVKPLEQKT